MGRRVLVTGLATFWGGRVAQHLERDPSVDVIVGLDRHEPTVELERTEYVRSDENYSILARIVKATKVDTIVHTFLMMDSSGVKSRTIHEINVIGTMNLFAAASAAGSTVRDVVVKSSTLVYGAGARDPNMFREENVRTSPPRTAVERSLLEVEGYVRDFAEDNPHVTVSLLRFSNVLGPDIRTPLSKALSLPLVPRILGFDPRFQFVHEDDVIRAILFVLDRQLPGIYNVAADGLLPWTEVAAICGKRTLPLPPFGFTGFTSTPLSRVGIELTPEVMDVLRYGRGVDNRRLKEAGFNYGYTSAGTVEAFVEAMRLRSTIGQPATYRYERDVEDFFRHSPAVVREPAE
ncbi:MAG: NAD-dependent epimerase/dehydratase family protein [Actinomycetota bacterium]|nr:NAD-dependent epimerase/dehydratase family protein [Acidimicrobiia bacterium]MDQ3293601.1 NAD-dependent epimerase/dehydratase family protein [Actinomycetota bacterium]